jgi:hypothetical protein
MPDDVKEAYQRGVRDGAIDEIDKAAGRAHDRLDKHDIRLTAIEKIMYSGLGALFLLELLPELSMWVSR